MDYNTAYLWMQDNASRDEWNIFVSITIEDEAIDYAQALGAYDPLDED
ncbi:hypothetical protein G5B30_16605 [Sphingobacterium sp. SGG-5]|nr:hypothetical protein [Sphingobacterium sp. SGG-5]NGM63532.1 hypothetical protein [Sphingobacterium sp. SGG-5]